MTGQFGESGWTPDAELLAAYADGELEDGPTGDLRNQIETWLARHPRAADKVEAQRRVTEWFQATTPADPPESAWEPVAARLQGLRLPLPGPDRRWSRWARLTALGITGAACVLLAFTLATLLGRREVPSWQGALNQPRAGASSIGPDMEALPVATAAEVEILSVQGDDTATLVVGELPLEGSLLLLQADELTLTAVEPARDNMVPEVRKGGNAPMIWAPLDAEREDPEEPDQV